MQTHHLLVAISRETMRHGADHTPPWGRTSTAKPPRGLSRAAPIGTTLAGVFREDLRRAGKGRGHCAFRFTSPFRLRAAQRSALVVRRAADGVELPGAGRIREQAAA